LNELDEASYYEIALTNRQVLVAFIILLVCMLASFFAGLWAGRGGALATATGDPVAELTEEATPLDPALEEFTFFSETEEEAAQELEELADDPNPQTTLAEDLGEQRPAQRDQKKPDPPPARTVSEPAPAAENPAIPRATARRAPPKDGSELYIQVFSSREVRQARKVLRQLLDAGYGAFLSPVEVDSSTMYRVRIGPFDERSAAEKTATQVRGRFRLDTWITSS